MRMIDGLLEGSIWMVIVKPVDLEDVLKRGVERCLMDASVCEVGLGRLSH